MTSFFKPRIKKLADRLARYVLDDDAHDIRRALQRRALQQTADFVAEEMYMVPPSQDRFALYESTLKMITFPGLICEFGVFKGESINYLADLLPKSAIYGFDSFQGLPVDWRSEVRAGHFQLERLPEVRPNVRLVKGWFHESLPPFLAEHAEPAAYLHIDSDLYVSAKIVLDQFAQRIQPGTVIVFDEYFNYPGWREGEYKAFQEFVAATGVRFEYVGYSARDEQVAVVIR